MASEKRRKISDSKSYPMSIAELLGDLPYKRKDSRKSVKEMDFDRRKDSRASMRTRAKTRSFIWGQEKPSLESTSTEVVKFSKEADNVEIQVQEPPDDGGDKHQPVSQQDLILAATLVNDAKEGRHSDFKDDEKSIRLYQAFKHPGLRYSLYLNIVLNLSLALFEKPCDSNLELPYWGTMIIEIFTLSFYFFRFEHTRRFTVAKRFWRDAKNVVVLVTLILTFIDIISYIILREWVHLVHMVRWSRPLRPLFLVNFAEARQIRRAFRNIRRTLPEVTNVLILFFINITIFTLMALKLFGRRNLTYPDKSPYFKDFFDSFFDLYVLVTTSNNPDVMMPAFEKSRWYVIFFVAFLLICLYLFMSIVLAVIYNNYKKHLKNEVLNSCRSKRRQLSRAFDLLKVEVSGKMLLPRARFNNLMTFVPPKRNRNLVNILWFVLDEDMDNYIEKSDFLKLSDLLNVEVTEIKDRKILIEKLFPRLYKSAPSYFLRMCVQHKFFRYTFDLLIVLNALFIILEEELADWIFLGFFLLEIVLKLYTLGVQQFFRRFWNVFDFVVIGSAVVTTIIENLSNSEEDETPTLDALLVLRVLRLVKIIGNVERFRVIVVTLMHIFPFMIIYGGVMLVFYYAFAIIGMELFQGLISYHGYETNMTENLFCGNPKLDGTDFYRNHYCANNFNSVVSATVVLFELTVVNQWHVLTAGYVTVTNKFARLYFIFFHLCCVIIVLNIFTAFVLEAFILEYNFDKGKMESAMETKIQQLGLGIDKDRPEFWVSYMGNKKNEGLVQEEDDVVDDATVDNTEKIGDHEGSLPDLSRDTDIRFHLVKNVKDVEVLLQRMFEDELDKENYERSAASDDQHENNAT